MKDLTDYSIEELRTALRIKRDQLRILEVENEMRTLNTALWNLTQVEMDFAGANNNPLWDAISRVACDMGDLTMNANILLKLIEEHNKPKNTEPTGDVQEKLRGC